jgi:uncharacterized RDD family membrane protein YckC
MEMNQFAVNGNLLKRSGAAIVDFIAFTLVSLFLISSAVGPFYDNQYQTSQLSNAFTTYQKASYLYAEDDATGQVLFVANDDIPDAIYAYYSIFRNGKTFLEETEPFVFTNMWYNTTILDIDNNSTLFELVNNDPTLRAVERSNLSESDQSLLTNFYTRAFNEALRDLATFGPYVELAQQINQYFIEILAIAASISLLVFYLLIPLLAKEGRTLGKLLLGLSVVSKDGYHIVWWQQLVRFMGLTLTFVLGIYTILGSILISYTFMIFTKNYRSLHDFVALTRVVDRKQSLLFKKEAQFIDYKASLDESSSSSQNFSV